MKSFSTKTPTLPPFPEYSNSLLVPLGSCSCAGAFSSCSKTCNTANECSCTCSAFSCSCSGCTKQGIEEEVEELQVSISKVQYENLKKVATILQKWDNESSKQSYVTLTKMVNQLKKKEYRLFKQEAQSLEFTLLPSLPKKEKDELNNLFVKVGSIFKIS